MASKARQATPNGRILSFVYAVVFSCGSRSDRLASGLPVISSDLPVVTALARPEVDALLVRPGSAKANKDGMLRLREDPDLGVRMSQSARRRIEAQFTWQHARDALVQVYKPSSSTIGRNSSASRPA